MTPLMKTLRRIYYLNSQMTRTGMLQIINPFENVDNMLVVESFYFVD